MEREKGQERESETYYLPLPIVELIWGFKEKLHRVIIIGELPSEHVIAIAILSSVAMHLNRSFMISYQGVIDWDLWGDYLGRINH